MDPKKYFDTAAIMNADGTYRCTATFITQRHLVTAAHCVGGEKGGPANGKYMNLPKPYLLVNGLCVRQGEMCGGVDMERREIGYIIYDFESLVDLAIIHEFQAQFEDKEQLPACLYGPWLGSEYQEKPPNVEIVAWGRYSLDIVLAHDTIKLTSDRLKAATFATVVGSKSPRIAKDCSGRTFCTTLTAAQVKPGDSGGSVYVRTSTFTLVAVVSGIRVIRDPQTNLTLVSYGIHVNLPSFHADFCRILGLCVEGKSWSESVPGLKWNSVYVARPLTDDPSVRYDEQFLTIEDKHRDELKAYCDGKRQLAKRKRHRSQQVDADTEFTWLAQVLRPDNHKVACLAIIISPQHLITQKRCFAEAKLAGSTPELYAGVTCRAQSEGCSPHDGAMRLPYEYVAWSDESDNDLAIVYLRISLNSEKFGADRFRAACLPMPEDAEPVQMTMYGFAPSDAGKDPADRLRFGSVNVVNKARPRRPIDGRRSADGVRNDCRAMGEQGTAIALADLRHYLDDICFYTNRCDHRNANNATFKSIRALDQYFQNWGPQRRHRNHKLRKHRH